MSILDKIRGVADQLGTKTGKDFNLDEIIKLNRLREERKQVYIKNDFETHEGRMTLVPLGDIHLGNRFSDIALLRSFVNYINETPGYYTVLLGDAAETSTRYSVGAGIYEEDMHLREQLITLQQIFQPIADKGKLLGVHTGNHEFRSAVLTGINPMELLASYLKVPYLEYQGYHVLRVGSQEYHMASVHGIGGGRTTGAKVNAGERLAQVNSMCHVYISGHSHIRDAHDGLRYYIKDDKLVPMRQYYAICGGFLGYFGGYTEQQILPPTAKGTVQIEFYADSHDIRVII